MPGARDCRPADRENSQAAVPGQDQHGAYPELPRRSCGYLPRTRAAVSGGAGNSVRAAAVVHAELVVSDGVHRDGLTGRRHRGLELKPQA